MPGNDREQVVWFVGAGPGDPDLITVRGRALLDRADVLLYAGSLVNPALVASSPAPEKVDSWGMHLDEIVNLMADRTAKGKTVVRLHSGDPALYGSIVEQIADLEKRGIAVRIVPGVSSVFAAAAALTTEYTPRGVSETLIVTRPAGKTLEADHIAGLSQFPATMAFFLGSDHFSDITKKLSCPPDTPAAVVFHASWPDQQVITGTVADIAQKAKDAGITRSALLIVGRAVQGTRSGYKRSHLYS
ncbi:MULTISPECIES: cobalt-precorrin-4/precorrin-4 C(11)-methyltransferase [unclassified Methanoregula]|uniref:cobalt-precorrin-4/precorrin-4 C(11)-methyltransferase n=1 Tax=unclassified Methanoregula TaxID=2649730 RepID=UPI0009D55D77|nr:MULTISPECIES: cobalt-precorrin-4/precorrin-4 C(11)-methyltransferase [unclassified Methanoregula]OPX64744.1 MAG: Uroporphyrinogen-III C-methyltransferase [Methanoregula sp. PtaB.Bin085]OPY35214.1 MAG: Uroporphyrinogen-III C-methyltransferase [Methanoregula sp. PtaU1.Bin006]